MMQICDKGPLKLASQKTQIEFVRMKENEEVLLPPRLAHVHAAFDQNSSIHMVLANFLQFDTN